VLQVKQQKTLDANQKALKAAEKKAQQQLKQVRGSVGWEGVRQQVGRGWLGRVVG